MEPLLAGKIALITGAGSGLGRAAALLFARHGARVVAADLDEARAKETARLVAGDGGQAVPLACDVTVPEETDVAVGLTVGRYGRLDIMFNNAGITLTPPPGKVRPTLLESTPEEIRRVGAVNIDGVVHGCQSAVRQFLAQGGGGVIVNTASIAGLLGQGSVVYSATKGAVIALTRTLAMEVAEHGIRVNAIAPAGMLTHFANLDPDGPNAERVRAAMASANPLGTATTPEQSAAAALFLASDLASGITGHTLPVDGGQTAGSRPR
jgi:NAD(P)-dependent dehydrogenase (short-subunit alcohol dehydrogenase family)